MYGLDEKIDRASSSIVASIRENPLIELKINESKKNTAIMGMNHIGPTTLPPTERDHNIYSATFNSNNVCR